MVACQRCPNCGGEMHAKALQGLCPACLLRHGLESEVTGNRPAAGTATTTMAFPRLISRGAEGEDLLRILELLDQFERAWEHGTPIALETLLGKTTGAGREELFRQALGIELDYRRGQGENPTREEYLRKFPDDADAVQDVFDEPKVIHDDNSTFSSPGQAVPEMLGKFQVIGRLGTGGQGSALLARDLDLGRLVVLKRYHTGGGGDEALRDGQALTRLRSRYVPQCYGIERVGAELVLVMEYVPGHNLSEAVKSGRFGTRAAATLIEQVAEGLEAVHACGLIHRDVKPANIVVGDEHVPRLVDFGLAAHLGSVALHGITGTPSYMAPEQARGQWERIDGRTDIYGLGAVFYALLTNQPPHPGRFADESLEHARVGIVTPPRAIYRSIPRNLERIVMKALERDPARRYATASDLRRALRHRRLRHRYWPVGLAAALLLVATAAYGMKAWLTAKNAGDLPVSVRPQQLIKVDRGGRELLLEDAVPLLTGDKLWIECDLPAGWFASAFWLDSEGRISELSPLTIKRQGPHDHLSYPSPDSADNSVTLEGPPGTEMVLICARPGSKVERREVEEIVPPSVARTTLRDRSALLIGRGRADLEISSSARSVQRAKPGETRGLGKVQESEARAAQEGFRQLAVSLEQRFDFVAGAVFPHRQSRQE